MPLGEAQWNELARELRTAWARVAPEWSDASAHDPGLTVLELLAYALTDLSFRSAALDERGRWIAARVAGCAAALAAAGAAPERDEPSSRGARNAGQDPADRRGDAAVLAMPRPLERALAEALEQQAASNVILRAILDAPTDARPAFEVLLVQALRSCDADLAFVAVPEGGRLVAAACTGCSLEGAAVLLASIEAASAADGTAEAAHDAAARRRPTEREAVPSAGPATAAVGALLAAPMRHEGRRLGLVAVGRHEARPFSEGQRHRLETLAEHAALAAEHVRRIERVMHADRAG